MRFGGGESEDFDDESGCASDEADFSDDEFGSEVKFGDEETKSRFTNYSMTSSVIKRNEGLTLLDDRFEKVCYIAALCEQCIFFSVFIGILSCFFRKIYSAIL